MEQVENSGFEYDAKLDVRAQSTSDLKDIHTVPDSFALRRSILKSRHVPLRREHWDTRDQKIWRR